MITYGIEKGLYRKEGIDLQFRVLRGELAVTSIVGGKDVDYMYGAGTAFFAAVRGLPMRVLSHDFKSVFFYLIGESPRAIGPGLERQKGRGRFVGRHRRSRYEGIAQSARSRRRPGRDADRYRLGVRAHGRHGDRFGGSRDHAGAVEFSS